VPVYHLNQHIAFYCDYFYYQTTTSYKYPVRSGRSGSGYECGFFVIRLDSGIQVTSMYYGACLSFKTH